MLPLFMTKADSRGLSVPSRCKKIFFPAAIPEGPPSSSCSVFLHRCLSSPCVERAFRAGLLSLWPTDLGLPVLFPAATGMILGFCFHSVDLTYYIN